MDEISQNEEYREQQPLLYSLKYILDFYFGEISIDTILNLSATSVKGFTSEIAIDVTNEVGLNAVEKLSMLLISPHTFTLVLFLIKMMPLLYL